MLGGNIGCVAAIHTRQTFQALAAAHMTEALILKADWCEFPQCGEVGQGRERLVVNILAADPEAAQCGHFRKCDESAAAEVGADASPKALQGLRTAQLEEAVIGGDRFLRP